MKALILTGGKGTRLRPFTTVIPKPLMPVGDYSILEILLRQLKKSGITEVILAVNYLSHLFQALFQGGERLGIKITYSFESKPLGTAGPIANCMENLDEDILVMNGDLLTTINFTDLIRFHRLHGEAATIGITQRIVKIDYGVIQHDTSNQLVDYQEKPVIPHFVSMGINMFKKSAIRSFIQKDQYLDIPTLMLNIKNSNQKVMCFASDALWLDIGRPDDYELANTLFEEKSDVFLSDLTSSSQLKVA